MMAEEKRMYEPLEEQEKLLLAQVEKVEKEIAKEKDNHLTTISKTQQMDLLLCNCEESWEKQKFPLFPSGQDLMLFFKLFEASCEDFGDP
ncbi:UNVERIFIED_CONTAM: hypothetical protein K2H54_034193 [Gekko kuhli]